MFGGLKACWDSDHGHAAETAQRLWASEVLPASSTRCCPPLTHFEQATGLVTVDRVFTCGDDPEQHVAAISDYVEAGFDEIYVSNSGPHYREFFAGYREHVLPKLKSNGRLPLR